MDETDFLSISSSNDSDYFSFEITTASTVDLAVTPLGANYNERVNSSDPYTMTTSASLSNLSLELFASDSTVPLAVSTSNPIGQPESILDFELLNPGEYVFRVSGSSTLTQMYQFSLAVDALEITQPGDFDNDADVDGMDFLAWQQGKSPIPFSANDLADWQAHYGMSSFLAGVEIVPEPTSMVFALTPAIFGRFWRRK
jgi:hypothetical protein